MSRTKREAQLRAIYGPKYGAVVITELGGRKRDKRKALEDGLEGEYQGGSVPDALSALTTWGAPRALQGLMNVDEGQFADTPLRNMSSYGSLGHMFAGSNAGPGGNPFDVTGTPYYSAPTRPQAAPPQRRADFYGLVDQTPYDRPPVRSAAPAAAPQQTAAPQMPQGRPWSELSMGGRSAGLTQAPSWMPKGTVYMGGDITKGGARFAYPTAPKATSAAAPRASAPAPTFSPGGTAMKGKFMGFEEGTVPDGSFAEGTVPSESWYNRAMTSPTGRAVADTLFGTEGVRKTLAQFQSPRAAATMIDIARNHPAAREAMFPQSRSGSELSELDRQAFMETAARKLGPLSGVGLLGAVPALLAGEAPKLGGGAVSAALGHVPGFGEGGLGFGNVEGVTSAPSLSNIGAGLQGFLRGAFVPGR